MALPQSYATLGEIPDVLRDHYTEKDNRWLLQTDPPIEDAPGLKSALDSERRIRRDAETQVSTLKAKFEGIDPADVVQMRERLESLKDKDVYDKDGLEALVGRRTQQMKDDTARQFAAERREKEALQTKYDALDATWRRDRIETALASALAQAEVTSKALPDAIRRGLEVFRDLDEDGRPVAKVIKEGKDETVYGKNGVEPLSPKEWILTLRSSGDAPHLWPMSSGSGAHQGSMNGIGGVDFSKLPPAERLTKYREAQSARK